MTDTPSIPNKRAYTVDEVIQITRLGKTAIYDRLRAGLFQSVTIAGQRLIFAESIRDFLNREEAA